MGLPWALPATMALALVLAGCGYRHGTYSLSVTPAETSVVVGNSTTVTATVVFAPGSTQQADSTDVVLSLEGAPAGVTASFDPERLSPPGVFVVTSTATLSASSAVAPGTYPIAVVGVDRYLARREVTIVLTVTSD